MKTYHYIYKVTLLLGKFKDHYYIGKHTTRAIPENCGYAGSGKILKCYYDKYGKLPGETYVLEILETNPDKYINAERERLLIGDSFKTDPLCINLKLGGDGGGQEGLKRSTETRKRISESLKGNPKLSHKGKNHPNYKGIVKSPKRPKTGFTVSEETRKKISESLKGNTPWNKGRKSTDEEREKNSAAKKKYYETHPGPNKGRVFSEEVRRHMSEGAKGKVLSEEHKKKISNSLKGRKVDPKSIENATKAKFKAVIGYDPVTGETERYESVTAAAKALGVNIHTISRVLWGKGKTCKGKKWYYEKPRG